MNVGDWTGGDPDESEVASRTAAAAAFRSLARALCRLPRSLRLSAEVTLPVCGAVWDGAEEDKEEARPLGVDGKVWREEETTSSSAQLVIGRRLESRKTSSWDSSSMPVSDEGTSTRTALVVLEEESERRRWTLEGLEGGIDEGWLRRMYSSESSVSLDEMSRSWSVSW